jgi:hypothetical protein
LIRKTVGPILGVSKFFFDASTVSPLYMKYFFAILFLIFFRNYLINKQQFFWEITGNGLENLLPYTALYI